MDVMIDRDLLIEETRRLQDELAAMDVTDPKYSVVQKELVESYKLSAQVDKDDQEYYHRQEGFKMQQEKHALEVDFDEAKITNARKEGSRMYIRTIMISGVGLLAVGMTSLADNLGVIRSTKAFNLATKLIPMAKL